MDYGFGFVWVFAKFEQMNEFKSSPKTQTSNDLVSSIGELDLTSTNIPTQGTKTTLYFTLLVM